MISRSCTGLVLVCDWSSVVSRGLCLQASCPGRVASPVELELSLVESGAKRDMFDAALQRTSELL